MANRAYFINHGEDAPVSLDNQKGKWLLAANYQLPVLWLAMFSEADLKVVSTRMQDAQGNQVIEQMPTLVAAVPEATRRYEERCAVLAAAISDSCRPQVEEWAAFIATQLTLPFVQLEMTELRIMEEPHAFDNGLREYLSVFASATDPAWDALRSQANLEDPQVARYGLRGYPWDSELKWK